MLYRLYGSVAVEVRRKIGKVARSMAHTGLTEGELEGFKTAACSLEVQSCTGLTVDIEPGFYSSPQSDWGLASRKSHMLFRGYRVYE